MGTDLQVYDDIMYLRDGALAGKLGVLFNGVEIFGRYSPCGFGSVCKDDCSKGGNKCVVDPKAPSDVVDAVDAEAHTVDKCEGHAAPTGG